VANGIQRDAEIAQGWLDEMDWSNQVCLLRCFSRLDLNFIAIHRISSLVALRAAVVDLENLLLRKEPIQKLSKDDLYDREHYLSSAHDPDLHFTKLYTYCFTLAKPAYVLSPILTRITTSQHFLCSESRNLEMETAVAFWDVLLAPKYPIAVELLEYIRVSAYELRWK